MINKSNRGPCFFILIFLVSCNLTPRKGLDYCSKCDVELNRKLQDSMICRITEIMPKFPGGEKEFLSYLISSINIKDEKLDLIESSYKISFVIDRNGSIKRPRFLNKDTLELSTIEQKIIQVLVCSPKWIPGKCGNKSIPILKIMPLKINFSIN